MDISNCHREKLLVVEESSHDSKSLFLSFPWAGLLSCAAFMVQGRADPA